MREATDRPADAAMGTAGVEDNGRWWVMFVVVFIVLFATAFAALVHSLASTFG